MKRSTFQLVILIGSIFIFQFSYSQSLSRIEATGAHSKNLAKKGLYAGTYLIDSGGARAFFMFPNKKKGPAFDAYDFGQDGKFAKADSEIRDAAALQSKFDIEAPQASPNEKFSTRKQIMIMRTNMLGVLVADKGYITPQYDGDFSPPFFTGYKFESEEKNKPKIKVLPVGFIPLGEVMDAIISSGSFKKVISGTGQETAIMGDSRVMVAGAIKEKIVVKKNPPPYNNNRFACLIIHGEGLEVEKEMIYEMPFAMVPVTSGKIGGDLGALYGTLNAPTTVKVTNQLNMKGEDKKRMLYIRVNKDAELVDTVMFKSTSARGTFGLFHDGNDVYIPGFINGGHEGNYRWDVGKITHFQMVKISGGKVEKIDVKPIEEIEAKLSVPQGEKAKFKITTNAAQGVFRFNEMQKLPNGDFLILGQSQGQYFAIQVGADGSYKQIYLIQEIDDEFIDYAFRAEQYNDKVYFTIQETPPDVTQGAHYSSRRYSTRVLRIDDVFNKMRVVKMDPATLSMSEQIDIGEKKYYCLGEEPLLYEESSGNIYITGSDRKKTLYMNTIK